MRLARPAVLVAFVTTLALCASASAASPSTLVYKDPKGDNMSPTASGDITGVTFTTTGTGKGKGYAAKNLVVTLALAATPEGNGISQYRVAWSIKGCTYYMDFAPGARVSPDFGFANCNDPNDPTADAGFSFGFLAQPKGSSITYKVAIKDLPYKVKPGMVFTDLYAWSDFVEPGGFFGPASATGPAYDEAETNRTYTLR